ncbi:MAG: DNA mismatch repair protein MutS [Spirochaetales bacterium]|nr:DNA mismatch repair protein MutS [Spirochaetales bacterium]
MKAHLLFPRSDFSPTVLGPLQVDLIQDLELDVLFRAMSNDDPFLLETVRNLLLAPQSDLEVLGWRQAVFKDCLKNQELVRQLYDWTVQAIEQERENYLSLYIKHPGFVISRSSEVLEMFLGILFQMRRLAEKSVSLFDSPGFRQFLSLLQTELNDDYLAAVRGLLEELKFPQGVVLSAKLGVGFKGEPYTLSRRDEAPQGWLDKLKSVLKKRPPSFRLTIAERDEKGARALSELYDHGVNQVANVLAQATDHLLGFLVHLRTELAFYIAGIQLKQKLDSKEIPSCFPELFSAQERQFQVAELVDPCLALSLTSPAVGNTFDGTAQNLVIVTGANQGGKSTFLRSVGLSFLMAQSGLFVAGQSCRLSVTHGLFTHFRRKEDASMTSGKLDEELARMNSLVEKLGSHAVVLFNESFAATNEREGSEIAAQIIDALCERKIRIFFVTHQYELARRYFDKNKPDAVFLQAELKPDGSRSFRLTQGTPQPGSHGIDLYNEIFG